MLSGGWPSGVEQ